MKLFPARAKNLLSSLSKKQLFGLLILLFLTLSTVVAVYLAGQKQDIRKRAAERKEALTLFKKERPRPPFEFTPTSVPDHKKRLPPQGAKEQKELIKKLGIKTADVSPRDGQAVVKLYLSDQLKTKFPHAENEAKKSIEFAKRRLLEDGTRRTLIYDGTLTNWDQQKPSSACGQGVRHLPDAWCTHPIEEIGVFFVKYTGETDLAWGNFADLGKDSVLITIYDQWLEDDEYIDTTPLHEIGHLWGVIDMGIYNVSENRAAPSDLPSSLKLFRHPYHGDIMDGSGISLGLNAHFSTWSAETIKRSNSRLPTAFCGVNNQSQLGTNILKFKDSQGNYFTNQSFSLYLDQANGGGVDETVDIQGTTNQNGSFSLSPSPFSGCYYGSNTAFVKITKDNQDFFGWFNVMDFNWLFWKEQSTHEVTLYKPEEKANFETVQSLSSSEFWAASKEGSIYHYQNGSLSKSVSPAFPTNLDFVPSISFSSANNGWAVFKTPSLYHYNGSLWTPVRFNFEGYNLWKVLSEENTIWIIGTKETAGAYDHVFFSSLDNGSLWQKTTLTAGQWFKGILDDIYATTDNPWWYPQYHNFFLSSGTLYNVEFWDVWVSKDKGGNWSRYLFTPWEESLSRRPWAISVLDKDLFVATFRGKIYHSFYKEGGGNWQEVFSTGDESKPLSDISMASFNFGYAVGKDGIYRFHRGAWTKPEEFPVKNLTAISILPDRSGWAVGEDGLIVKIEKVNQSPSLNNVLPQNDYSSQTKNNPVVFTSYIQDDDGYQDIQSAAFGIIRKEAFLPSPAYLEKFIAVRVDRDRTDANKTLKLNILDKPGLGQWWQWPMLNFGSEQKIYFNYDERDKTTTSLSQQPTSFAYLDLKESSVLEVQGSDDSGAIELKLKIGFLEDFETGDYQFILWAKDQVNASAGWTKMGEWKIDQLKPYSEFKVLDCTAHLLAGDDHHQLEKMKIKAVLLPEETIKEEKETFFAHWPNNSFEKDSDHNGLADGLSYPPARPTRVSLTPDKVFGEKAQQVSCSQTWCGVFKNFTNLEENTDYTLSGWLKVYSGNLHITIVDVFRLLRGQPDAYLSTLDFPSTNYAYQFFNLTFQTKTKLPASATLPVSFYFLQAGGQPTEFAIDGMNLTKGQKLPTIRLPHEKRMRVEYQTCNDFGNCDQGRFEVGENYCLSEKSLLE